eukprot:gb/GECG01014816.1/.p1 GENE.gb/GECG01014816.1/~~gb/GECG01014816.1/.p1  ORF type:complete len:158 (+),score=15.35 gb/GECG01014816.1/:1-474(+)
MLCREFHSNEIEFLWRGSFNKIENVAEINLGGNPGVDQCDPAFDSNPPAGFDNVEHETQTISNDQISDLDVPFCYADFRAPTPSPSASPSTTPTSSPTVSPSASPRAEIGCCVFYDDVLLYCDCPGVECLYVDQCNKIGTVKHTPPLVGYACPLQRS